MNLLRNRVLTISTFFTCATIAHADFAIDFGTGTTVSSSIGDFQAVDTNLDGSTSVTNLTSWGAMDGLNLNGLTLSTTGSDTPLGPFDGSASSFNSDLAILDGYVFGRTDRSANDFITVSISGFSAFSAGETITLTTWGIGDNEGQQTSFNAVFGSDDQTLETLYTDLGNGGTQGTSVNTIATSQFTFTADGVTDTIVLTPDGALSAGSNVRFPINGFSVSVVPETSSFALIAGLVGIAMTAIRRVRK